MMHRLLAVPVLLLLAGCCCPKPCCEVAGPSEATPPKAEAWRPVEPVAPPPSAAARGPNPYKVLATKRVKGLDWEEQNLDQVLMYLRTISGLSFEVSPKVREEKFDDISISAQLDDVDLRTVLNVVVTEPYELAYEVRKGNVIWIITEDEKDKRMRLRYFDVKDLVGTSTGGGKSGKPRQWQIDEVKAAELDVGIRKTVAPAVWTRDDVTMEMRNGIMIVRAPRDVLHAVGDFLDRKRRLTSK